jgi:hypothetical protein
MTRQTWKLSLVTLMLVVIAAAASPQSSGTYVPPDGFVPDAATAMRIAEAVWIPIYGAQSIADEKPLKAVLAGDVWTVTGKDLPPNTLGGVATAEVLKSDGRIRRVSHGQ